MTELKPCPFCGSEAEITGSGIAGRIRIECSNRPCQNSREVYTTATPAVQAWNTRSSWQDIETAPKDGTWVYTTRRGDKTPIAMRWISFDYWWDYNRADWEERVKRWPDLKMMLVTFEAGWFMEGDTRLSKDFAPTYWQPLPAPPEEE